MVHIHTEKGHGYAPAVADKERWHWNMPFNLEDGSLDGGYGETVARFYGPSSMSVLNFGVRKMLYDRYNVNQLLMDNHLQDQQIAEDIIQAFRSK